MLTNEDREEEKGDRDVDYWSRHVQKPIRSHGKKSKEEQKEEQTVLVLLHLEKDRMESGEFLLSSVYLIDFSKVII